MSKSQFFEQRQEEFHNSKKQDHRLDFIESERLGKGRNVLGFGKYANNTFNEVLELDPKYLLWAHDNTDKMTLSIDQASKVKDAISRNHIDGIIERVKSDKAYRQQLIDEYGESEAAKMLHIEKEVGKEIAMKKKGFPYKARITKTTSPSKVSRKGKERLHPLFGGDRKSVV